MPNNTGEADSLTNANAGRTADGPGVARVLAAFERFHHRLMTEHAEEFAAVELTMAQAKVIYIVVAGGELSVSEIANCLGVTLSTASGAVDRLVELGMLSRSAVPGNRRQVSISATELGVHAIDRLGELGVRQMRAFLADLSEPDLAIVQRAVEILAGAIPPPSQAVPFSPGRDA